LSRCPKPALPMDPLRRDKPPPASDATDVTSSPSLNVGWPGTRKPNTRETPHDDSISLSSARRCRRRYGPRRARCRDDRCRDDIGSSCSRRFLAGRDAWEDRRSIVPSRSAEDADASWADHEAGDDQNDAVEHGAADERENPRDHEDRGDDPQDRRHPAAAAPGRQEHDTPCGRRVVADAAASGITDRADGRVSCTPDRWRFPLRAAFLERPGVIQVRTAEDVRPAEGQAVIRVRAVGICGTDLGIAHGKIPVTYPRVLGHEVVGELIDPGQTSLDRGTTVLVDPGLSCGRCQQCREGKTNICTNAGLLGRDADGGLRELLAVPPTHVFEVPSTIEPAIAPMIQVLATCVHGHRRVPITPGETVAVLGLGVTGLLHVQIAKQRGARVVAITRTAAKREIAASFGADMTVVSEDGEVAEVVGDVDVAIESAGTVATLAHAVEIVRVGGRILAFGTIGRGATGSIPYYDLYYKELDIIGARSAVPADFVDAVEMVASGKVPLEPLVSARFDLDRIRDAFAAAASSGSLKIFVDV
jgi:L-iditol 2-dehydrogenase